MVSRRTFLSQLASGAALSLVPAGARANLTSLGAPLSQEYSVLEIFLGGGLSHRETLWVDPDAPGGQFGHVIDLDWATLTGGRQVLPVLWPTGVDNRFFSAALTPLVGTPLWDNRRLIHTGHGLSPHRVAQSYMSSGQRPQREDYTSTGAVANRLRPDMPSAGWVFSHYPGSEVEQDAVRTGTLGSALAPPRIPFAGNRLAPFLDTIQQPVPTLDEGLTQLFADRLRRSLTTPSDEVLRSSGFDDYDAAARMVRKRQSLASALVHALDFTSSPWDPETLTPASRMILGACRLIHQGDATYVNTVDLPRVIIGDDAISLDTHDRNYLTDFGVHASAHNLNLFEVCWDLRRAMDAGLLDPARTMVVINTEFGRAPEDTSENCRADATDCKRFGSNHYPRAFSVLMMGGPMFGARTIGGIDGEHWQGGSLTSGSADPQHIRIAIHAALGDDSSDLAVTEEATHNLAATRDLFQF